VRGRVLVERLVEGAHDYHVGVLRKLSVTGSR
jgi:hypothetical protein